MVKRLLLLSGLCIVLYDHADALNYQDLHNDHPHLLDRIDDRSGFSVTLDERLELLRKGFALPSYSAAEYELVGRWYLLKWAKQTEGRISSLQLFSQSSFPRRCSSSVGGNITSSLFFFSRIIRFRRPTFRRVGFPFRLFFLPLFTNSVTNSMAAFLFAGV